MDPFGDERRMRVYRERQDQIELDIRSVKRLDQLLHHAIQVALTGDARNMYRLHAKSEYPNTSAYRSRKGMLALYNLYHSTGTKSLEKLNKQLDYISLTIRECPLIQLMDYKKTVSEATAAGISVDMGRQVRAIMRAMRPIPEYQNILERISMIHCDLQNIDDITNELYVFWHESMPLLIKKRSTPARPAPTGNTGRFQRRSKTDASLHELSHNDNIKREKCICPALNKNKGAHISRCPQFLKMLKERKFGDNSQQYCYQCGKMDTTAKNCTPKCARAARDYLATRKKNDRKQLNILCNLFGGDSDSDSSEEGEEEILQSPLQSDYETASDRENDEQLQYLNQDNSDSSDEDITSLLNGQGLYALTTNSCSPIRRTDTKRATDMHRVTRNAELDHKVQAQLYSLEMCVPRNMELAQRRIMELAQSQARSSAPSSDRDRARQLCAVLLQVRDREDVFKIINNVLEHDKPAAQLILPMFIEMVKDNVMTINELREQIKDLTSYVNALKPHNELLVIQLRSCQETYTTNVDELTKCKTAYDVLEEKYENSKACLKNAENDNAILHREIAQMRSSISLAKTNLNQMAVAKLSQALSRLFCSTMAESAPLFLDQLLAGIELTRPDHDVMVNEVHGFASDALNKIEEACKRETEDFNKSPLNYLGADCDHDLSIRALTCPEQLSPRTHISHHMHMESSSAELDIPIFETVMQEMPEYHSSDDSFTGLTPSEEEINKRIGEYFSPEHRQFSSDMYDSDSSDDASSNCQLCKRKCNLCFCQLLPTEVLEASHNLVKLSSELFQDLKDSFTASEELHFLSPCIGSEFGTIQGPQPPTSGMPSSLPYSNSLSTSPSAPATKPVSSTRNRPRITSPWTTTSCGQPRKRLLTPRQFLKHLCRPLSSAFFAQSLLSLRVFLISICRFCFPPKPPTSRASSTTATELSELSPIIPPEHRLYNTVNNLLICTRESVRKKAISACWDSGAVANTFYDASVFNTIDYNAPVVRFNNAAPEGTDSAQTVSAGLGTVTLYLKNETNNKLTPVTIKAHYIPTMRVNLLSVGTWARHGLFWNMEDGTIQNKAKSFVHKLTQLKVNDHESFLYRIHDQRDSGHSISNLKINLTDLKSKLESQKTREILKIGKRRKHTQSTKTLYQQFQADYWNSRLDMDNLYTLFPFGVDMDSPDEADLDNSLFVATRSKTHTEVRTPESQTLPKCNLSAKHNKKQKKSVTFDSEELVQPSPEPLEQDISVSLKPSRAKLYDSTNNNAYAGTRKDYADWKFEKLSEILTEFNLEQPELELFSDKQKNNSLLQQTFTPDDNAFHHKWTGKFFYGNPDYNDEFVARTLTKALWDYSLEPFSTKFLFVLPQWKTASWYPLLRHYDILKTYEIGTKNVFSAVNDSTLNPKDLKPTPDGRAWIGPTKWKVLVIYKDANTKTDIDGVMKLHLTLGHKSAEYIKYAIQDDPELLKYINNDLTKLNVPIFCQVCSAAKSRSEHAKRESPLTTRFAESFHADLKVYSLPSDDGYKYIFGIIDSFTRYTWIYFLKQKSEAANKLEIFCNSLITSSTINVESLQQSRFTVDNAKEFTGKEFTAVLSKYQMQFCTTAEYKHTDNAIIESFWRNENTVRAMLIGAPHLSKSMWPYAWLNATMLHNNMPHKYHGHGTNETTDIMQPSPFEQITGRKPTFAHFSPFGMPGKCHIPVEKRARSSTPKLTDRSFTGYFLYRGMESTKFYVQNAETSSIVKTSFFQPSFSLDSQARIVSNANTTNNIDLEDYQIEKIAGEITQIQLSNRTNVHAIQLLDISVTRMDNSELLAVLNIKMLNQQTIWMRADQFLTGNRDRKHAHKSMLLAYLRNHFKYRENVYYPMFVETEVKLYNKKDTTEYPALIIGIDSNATKGYLTALFEHGDGNESIVDLHDCVAADITQFEVAKILMPVISDCLDTTKIEGRSSEKQCNTLFELLNNKNKKVLSKRQKTFMNDPTLPQGYNHAKSMPDAVAWEAATVKELSGLYEIKKTFELLTDEQVKELKENNTKILDSKFVYKRKLDADGNIKTYKVRLCAGGDKQKWGDGTFDETHAPTATKTSTLVCLSLSTTLKLKRYQLDVEQAFLNTELDRPLYMSLPAGVTLEEKRYVKLHKAIYGLKQAPNLWYLACRIAIEKSEPRLTRMKSDPCFFFCLTKELVALITVTVDDFAIFTNDEKWFYDFKEKFHKQYSVTQEPTFDWFLGIKMDWNEDGSAVKLTQPNHINAALIKYHMEDSKLVPTPMISDFDSTPLPPEHINPDFPYAGIIGTLMWIARNTRPDILTAVTLLASHNNRFGDYHIKQAKRVLAYLKSTKEYGVTSLLPRPLSPSLLLFPSDQGLISTSAGNLVGRL